MLQILTKCLFSVVIVLTAGYALFKTWTNEIDVLKLGDKLTGFIPVKKKPQNSAQDSMLIILERLERNRKQDDDRRITDDLISMVSPLDRDEFLIKEGEFDEELKYGGYLLNIQQKAKVLYYKANDFYNDQKYDEALEYYQRSYTNAKTGSAAYYVSRCLFKKGDTSGAKKWIKLGIENARLSKNKAAAITYLGDILYRNGQYKHAIRHYERAIGINPNSHVTLYHLGNGQMKLEDYQKAAESYIRCLKLTPNYINAKVNLAYCYIKFELYPEALRLSDEVLVADMDNSIALSNKGVALHRTGDHTGAVLCFDKIVKLDSSNTLGWFSLGQAYRGTEEIAEALDAYQKAVTLNPEFYPALWYAGVTTDLLKGPGAGKDLISRYLQYVPRSDPNRAKAEGYMKRFR